MSVKERNALNRGRDKERVNQIILFGLSGLDRTKKLNKLQE